MRLFVYATSAVSGRIKIGLTGRPRERLNDLRRAHGKGVRFVALVEATRRREQVLLSALAAHAVEPEWFVARRAMVIRAVAALRRRLRSKSDQT